MKAKSWNNYIKKLREVDKKAYNKVSDFITTHNVGDYPTEYDYNRAIIDYAYAVCTKYGEASAELACQMYEECAALEGITVPPAVPARTASYREVAKAINGAKLQGEAVIPNAAERLVKLTGQDTTLQNALRDGAEWAWIPQGDTCSFCVTLASRGWQKASKKAIKNGHAEHIHANCDCAYCIRFSDDVDVEGYDPGAYLEQYRAAGSDINAMRRKKYKTRKDLINYQKRTAYKNKQDNIKEQREENLKHIDKDSYDNYNKFSINETLADDYHTAVNDGWISPLCRFEDYKIIYYLIEKKLIGKKTSNKVIITAQSKHFISRVIGTGLDPNRVNNGVYFITKINEQQFKSNARDGVKIADIIDALKNGRVDPIRTSSEGKRSQKFIGNNCIVTINPDTGVLIQCNKKIEK